MTTRIGGSASFYVRAMGALQTQKLACADPDYAQSRVFSDLLSQVRDTAFGREHSLRYVRTTEDWRDAVPVREYSEFTPYIDRIAAGEDAVLTRSRPYGFLKTSGTSGVPKYVPTTEHWRRAYRGPALYAQWGLYFHLLNLAEVDQNTAFDMSWERPLEPPTAVHGALPVFSITQRHESLGGADWTPPWYGAPWFRAHASTAEETLYVRARYLAGQGVRMVVSVNPSKIVLLGEVVRTRAEQLIRDIRNGTCLDIAHPQFGPDPALAQRLEAACARDGGLRIDHLWPRLEFLVCWTSASAKLYAPWLRSIAPGATIIPFSTTGTEGIVTLPIDAEAASGALAVNQGFYEFAQVDDAASSDYGDFVPFDDLEVGGTYRLIMSQANGLYRYDTGDLYRVSGWAGRTPRIEFLSRAGNVSSFTGEKLTEDDIGSAVLRAFARRGEPAPMYTAVPVWGEPPGYVVVVEESSAGGGAHGLADGIDRELQGVNIEYREKRETGRLRALEVELVRTGAFERELAARVARGASPAQVKHHWLQRDDAVLAAFRERGDSLQLELGALR